MMTDAQFYKIYNKLSWAHVPGTGELVEAQVRTILTEAFETLEELDRLLFENAKDKLEQLDGHLAEARERISGLETQLQIQRMKNESALNALADARHTVAFYEALFGRQSSE